MLTFSKRLQLLGLSGWLFICFGTSAIGAAASIQAKDLYREMVQPVWAPAPWVFAPVWSILYAMMGVAAWLVWRSGGFKLHKTALVGFLIQLMLNGLWSWLFFAWRLGDLALLEIILLWVSITVTLVLFWRVNRLAGMLLMPYLIWVSFASALNYSLLMLNQDLLGR